MTDVQRPPRRGLGLRVRTVKWTFVAPAMAILLALTLFPLLYSLALSFRRYSPLVAAKPFVGFANYGELFTSQGFLHALLMTLAISIAALIVEFILGMIVAVATSNLPWGSSAVITISLLPVFMVPVVIGYLWRYLLSVQAGPVDEIISWITGRPFTFDWLNTNMGSYFALVLADVWQWTPFMFLVLYAGMSGVPPEIYEAGDLAGCNAWQRFRFLTLPLLRPAIMIAVTIRAVDTLKIFGTIWAMTQGGPGTFTQNLPIYIYKHAFQQFTLGYASAATYVVLILSSLIATLLVWIITRTGAGRGRAQ